jgi:hypothetical protein
LETYRQPDLLFSGNGAFGFQDISSQVKLDQAPVRSSRGGAFCDYDNDGDLDLLVLAIDDPPTLLRNDGGNGRNWLQFRLTGRRGNRSAVGARVKVVSGSTTRTGRVRSGGGYLSQNDLRLHFGLGDTAAADRVEIRWSGGESQILTNVQANQIVRIEEAE